MIQPVVSFSEEVEQLHFVDRHYWDRFELLDIVDLELMSLSKEI